MTEHVQSATRSGRILQFPLVRMVMGFAWLGVAIAAAQLAVQLLPVQETIPTKAITLLIVTSVVYLAYHAFVRVIEKRPVSELAASGAVTELTSGVLIGATLFTVVIGVLWALGYYSITGGSHWAGVVLAFASAVHAGVVEEILMRGVLFRITEETLGTWLALLISALIFGLGHLGNPHATLVTAVAIALEAGVLLAAAYVLTRRLWLAIGIHFAWNFTQIGVFGIGADAFGNPASGLFMTARTGPELLSGGTYGAEASIFAVVVCLAGGVYLLRRAQKKGNFVKLFGK